MRKTFPCHDTIIHRTFPRSKPRGRGNPRWSSQNSCRFCGLSTSAQKVSILISHPLTRLEWLFCASGRTVPFNSKVFLVSLHRKFLVIYNNKYRRLDSELLMVIEAWIRMAGINGRHLDKNILERKCSHFFTIYIEVFSHFQHHKGFIDNKSLFGLGNCLTPKRCHFLTKMHLKTPSTKYPIYS